jgi:putative solute:sodium symporter small subunit
MAPENATQVRARTPPGSSPDSYWRANLRIMAGLLVIWAAAGVGASILIADWLNRFTLPGTGFPLGFWFAHQGSILVFVLLILAYCVLMNRLDSRHAGTRVDRSVDADDNRPVS